MAEKKKLHTEWVLSMSKRKSHPRSELEKMRNLWQHQKAQELKTEQQNFLLRRQELLTHQPQGDVAALEAEHQATLLQLEKKYEEKLAQLVVQEQHLTERLHTESELTQCKANCQSQVQEWEGKLKRSKDELQGSYRHIEQLKQEQETCLREVERHQSQLQKLEHTMSTCSAERQRLSTELSQQRVSHQQYRDQMAKVMEAEQKSAAQVLRLKEQQQKRQEQMEALKAAIEQSHMQMKQEKLQHIDLQQNYRQCADKLVAVTNALEQCKNQQLDSKTILAQMTEQYTALQQQSRENILALRQLTEKSQRQTEETVKARVAREQVEAELKAVRQTQVHNTSLMSQCQLKNEEHLLLGKQQSQRLEQLEQELQASRRVAENETLLRQQVAVMSSAEKQAQVDQEGLTQKLRRLEAENQMMKDQIQSYEEFKREAMSTSELFHTLKKSHRSLQQEQEKVTKELNATQNRLKQTEASMAEIRDQLQACDVQARQLKDQEAKCLYPGEKQHYQLQVEELLRQRNSMRDQLQTAMREQGHTFEKLQRLVQENDDLKVIRDKYELESNQIGKLAEQTARLGVELNQSKKLVGQKDEQLETLAQQVRALVERMQTLGQREAVLNQRLQASVSAEDLLKAQNQLTQLKVEHQRAQNQLQESQTQTNVIQQQQELLQTKVKTLVELLGDTEKLKLKLATEMKTQQSLQESLRECQTNQVTQSTQLKDRIRMADEQFQEATIKHRQLMEASAQRIKELEQRLTREVAIDQQQKLPRQPMAMPPLEAAPKSTPTPNTRDLQQRASAHVDEMKSFVSTWKSAPLTPDVSKQVALAPPVAAAQEVKQQLQDFLRKQESKVSQARGNMYDNILQLLETTQSRPSGSGSVLDELTRIQRTSEQREQAALQDMLEVQAINKRLNTEYNAARNIQSQVLTGTQQRLQGEIQATATRKDPTLLIPPVNAYNSFSQNQLQFLKAKRQDVQQQMQHTNQWMDELMDNQQKMNQVMRSLDGIRHSDVDQFRQTMAEHQDMTNEALHDTRQRLSRLSEQNSGVEGEIDHLMSSVTALTSTLKTALSQAKQKQKVNVARGGPGWQEGDTLQHPTLQVTPTDEQNVIVVFYSVHVAHTPWATIDQRFVDGIRHLFSRDDYNLVSASTQRCDYSLRSLTRGVQEGVTKEGRSTNVNDALTQMSKNLTQLHMNDNDALTQLSKNLTQLHLNDNAEPDNKHDAVETRLGEKEEAKTEVMLAELKLVDARQKSHHFFCVHYSIILKHNEDESYKDLSLMNDWVNALGEDTIQKTPKILLIGLKYPSGYEKRLNRAIDEIAKSVAGFLSQVQDVARGDDDDPKRASKAPSAPSM